MPWAAMSNDRTCHNECTYQVLKRFEKITYDIAHNNPRETGKHTDRWTQTTTNEYEIFIASYTDKEYMETTMQ